MLDDFCEYVHQDDRRGGFFIGKVGTACYHNQMKKQESIKKPESIKKTENIKKQQKSDDGSFIRKLGSAFRKKNMKEQESDEER